MEEWQDEPDARSIFQELSYVVASCIMFDSARNKNKGTVESIFPLYLEHLDAALENFATAIGPVNLSNQELVSDVSMSETATQKGTRRKTGKSWP